MSDVMLLGVLRLPLKVWTDDPLFKMQQHSRCVEAADRIEADAEALSQSESRRKELTSLLHEAELWLGPNNPLWDAKEPGTLEKLHARIVVALSKEPK